jgi:signal transduction histidine kinase
MHTFAWLIALRKPSFPRLWGASPVSTLDAVDVLNCESTVNRREKAPQATRVRRGVPGDGGSGVSSGASAKAAAQADTSDARELAVRAREQLEFLLEVSDSLNEPLDFEQSLRTLARLLVPRFGVLCMIDVRENDRLRRVESHQADPALREAADRLRTVRLGEDRPYLCQRVVQTGQAELITDVAEDYLLSVTQDEQHLAALRSFSPQSILCVPLIAHDRTLGAITLIRDHSAPGFDAGDLRFMQEIARRAAQAIDNAWLYHEARRVSQQRDHVLGVVSHDLGNALSAIAMCTTALTGAAGDAPEKRAALLATIRNSTDWMRRLIADLVDVASIEAGRLSFDPVVVDPVLLSAHAVHLYEPVAEQNGVHLSLHVPEVLPPVKADQARLLQVLSNLLTNALHVTSSGGEITVMAQRDEESVRFSVRDNGPGIPTEHVPHIFDRFWRYRRGDGQRGVGLGLAIARGIVDAHGGRIWVETALGTGTTFHFTIPVGPS